MTSTTFQNNDEHSAATTALSTKLADQDLRVPCYCEENVWRLAYRKVNQQQQVKKNSHDSSHKATKQYYVVFVSNPSKCVCYFHQLASEDPSRPVFWDYHVLLLEQRNNDGNNNDKSDGEEEETTTLVYDIDSRLPYPVPLSDYLEDCFPDLCDPRNAKYLQDLLKMAPLFRVVEAHAFLDYFSSNRSHMWNAAKQKWNADPPDYDCIQAPSQSAKVNSHSSASADNSLATSFEGEHNLAVYTDMEHNLNHEQFGTVLTMSELKAKFE